MGDSDMTERTADTKPVVIGAEYTLTEEEKKVFKQCDQESFWYRSVPFSASAMTLTHMLVTTGKLTASPRFGSLPKVLFAGMCGYFAGKLSYLKTCQQKFYSLENSPIAEALRQRHRHPHRPPPPPQFTGPQSGDRAGPSEEEMLPQFDAFQSESVSESPYSPPDFSYSNDTHSVPPPDLHTHVPHVEEEEETKRKPILYEELRNRNRENYDITRTQKITQDTPRKEVKKNKYGDSWEDE